MRQRHALIIMAAAAAALVGPTTGRAAAPEGTKTVVLENDRVRAMAIEYPPGARGPEHGHAAPRVVVVLEGGTLEIRDARGGTRTLLAKAGEVFWRPPERHALANPGATSVRLVEIDLLDCPAR